MNLKIEIVGCRPLFMGSAERAAPKPQSTRAPHGSHPQKK